MRRIETAIVSLLVVLSACTGSTESAPKAVATAGSGTGDVMVRGVITRNAEPVRDAELWFDLWPTDDGTRAGDVVDTWGSKHVKTDHDGRFALRMDPDDVKSKYIDGNAVNFDLNLFHDKKMASWGSTAWLVQDRVWRSDEYARVADPTLSISMDVGTFTVTLVDSHGERETNELTMVRMPARFDPK